MTDDHSQHGADQPKSGSFWTSKAFLVCLGFLAMALVLLWSEHRAHILGVIPYLFLLACPLMHLFMHGGHSHHHGGENTAQQPPTAKREERP
jgi:hypothetical protein